MLPPTHTRISMEPSLHLAQAPGSLNKAVTSLPLAEEKQSSLRNLAGHQQVIPMARPLHHRQIKLLPKAQFSPAWAINVSSSAHSMTHGKLQVNTTWNSIGYKSSIKSRLMNQGLLS